MSSYPDHLCLSSYHLSEPVVKTTQARLPNGRRACYLEGRMNNPILWVESCKMSVEAWCVLRDLTQEIQAHNSHVNVTIQGNTADSNLKPHPSFVHSNSKPVEDLNDTVEICGVKFTREVLKHPAVAQMLQAGFRPDPFTNTWCINQNNLVARFAETVAGDTPNELFEKVTSGVGAEIRNDLTKVFRASSLDIQKLNVIVSRRKHDGVLVCNMCIEAVDNGD